MIFSAFEFGYFYIFTRIIDLKFNTMKKVVLVAFAFMALFTVSCKKDNAAAKVKTENVEKAKERDAQINKGAPVVEWNKTEHDFGKVAQGDKVETIFTLTNVGDSDLIVSNAKGSCGCTVPNWPREAIAPGQSADIKVEFNSRGKKNNTSNTVTLTTNTESGKEVVRIKAFVEVPERPKSDAPMMEDN